MLNTPMTLEEPGIWKNFKAESNYHYNPMAVPDVDPFKTLCTFKGEWQAGIDLAMSLSKENAVIYNNPRKRSPWDEQTQAEEDDLNIVSGRDYFPNLNYCEIYGTHDFDEDLNPIAEKRSDPEFVPFFKMLKGLGMYEYHHVSVHIQRTGQISAFHIDRQYKYFRKDKWIQSFAKHGADKNPLKLRRIFISLTPWQFGHVFQFGNKFWTGYAPGEAVAFDWRNMPHGTANTGWTPRVNIQATGYVDDKFEWLLKNGSKDYIIDLDQVS